MPKRKHQPKSVSPALPDYSGGATDPWDEAESAVRKYAKDHRWERVEDAHLPELIQNVVLAPMSRTVAMRLVDLRFEATLETAVETVTWKQVLALPNRKGQDLQASHRNRTFEKNDELERNEEPPPAPRARPLLGKIANALRLQSLPSAARGSVPREWTKDAVECIEKAIRQIAGRPGGRSLKEARAFVATKFGLPSGDALVEKLRRLKAKIKPTE